MASILPTTNVLLLNTRTNAGSLVLPPTTQIPGRVLTLKDSTGSFSTNALTLTTSAGDLFEDNSTTTRIRTSFGNVQLLASTNRWFVIGGTQVTNLAANTITTTLFSTNSLSTNTLTLSSLTFNQVTPGVIFQSSSQLFFNSTIIAGGNVQQGLTLLPSPVPSFSITTVGATIQTFTSLGGFTNYTYVTPNTIFTPEGLNQFNVVGTIGNAEVLLVGGGGTGGSVVGRSGGGGGGGGFINQSTSFTTGTYRIRVGAGGVPFSTSGVGGDSEIVGLLRAFGGGGGANNDYNTVMFPSPGGSGGGGSAGLGGAPGIPGQGHGGGTGFNSGTSANFQAGGGGGGACNAGSNSSCNAGVLTVGNGGSGRISFITGGSVTYGGGGGAGKRNNVGGVGGTGGAGGGGQGGRGTVGSNGSNQLGGGAGGGGGLDIFQGIGGIGGSGIVIIRVYNT